MPRIKTTSAASLKRSVNLTLSEDLVADLKGYTLIGLPTAVAFGFMQPLAEAKLLVPTC
jgi:hypothetical protein